MKRKTIILISLLAVVLVAAYFIARRPPRSLVLTGVVTTDEIIVSSEIQGRVQKLLVGQGDSVTNHQLLAVIQPKEWQADLAFYAQTEQQWGAQVTQAEADLKFQEAQTSNQVWQAQSALAAMQAQVKQSEADLEIARLSYQREEGLYQQGVEAVQAYDQARTGLESAKARVQSLEHQVNSARATVALARSNDEQVAARRAAVAASRHQMAAAAAQKEKAEVRLDYTEIHAPTNGLVDVRAALQGEVVNPGQGILTLVNPDDFWVRMDIEETYIDRIHLGDRMTVRLPSGATREGTVFYRAVDADYATQRDVSRTKRDIKTFEVRLRCDNRDRSLALGMTAYVTVVLAPH